MILATIYSFAHCFTYKVLLHHAHAHATLAYTTYLAIASRGACHRTQIQTDYLPLRIICRPSLLFPALVSLFLRSVLDCNPIASLIQAPSFPSFPPLPPFRLPSFFFLSVSLLLSYLPSRPLSLFILLSIYPLRSRHRKRRLGRAPILRLAYNPNFTDQLSFISNQSTVFVQKLCAKAQ